MYKYKYIPLSIKASAQKGKYPKDNYRRLFQETLNEQFYNASNWYSIEEETYLGSQEYQYIDVRISHTINAETGVKLGDDFKTLFFKEIDYNIEVGKLYRFDNNIWITTNTEYRKNLTGTCTIRRCNNTLRWIDEDSGAYYEEPCSIERLVKEPRNYSTQGSAFLTPGGFLHIFCQFNERTNLISENQRFLFGNENHWTCYRVIGTGVNDFTSEKTYDKDSVKIIILDLIADFVNRELDDIVNGYANENTNIYVIEINKSEIQGTAGDTYQLSTTITYNGDTVTRDTTWTTTNPSIATVSSSGLITLIKNGACIIVANVEDNSTNDTCAVTVTDTPETINDIVISPTTNYILEGLTQEYTVYLYENGVQQADTFTITCENNDIPITSYTFTQIDDNTFSIENSLRNNTSHLTITCDNGDVSKDFDIFLKGAW